MRETKTVNGVTYHYHYDGSDLIRVTDDSGQTVWAFTWANGKPNTVTNQNGNTFYYVTNYRGDVIRIVDENGATVANYSYDPWGKVLSVLENAAVTGQPIGYAGYYYDRETKLYYLQARYYDPETARFISRDAYPGDKDNPLTQNGYTYTNDNPVMYVDPDGNNPLAVALIIAAIEDTLIWFGRAVVVQIVKKVTPYILQAYKKYGKKLKVSGPKRSKENKDNHTLFTISYGKKQLLRIDMKVLKRSKEYIGYIHFHVFPDMSKHYDITHVNFGKNLPKFPW
nr:RHS repeat-associated core domain-containing protein [Anoxybacillus rupiensis]